jgi:hypothetical protein
MFTHALNAFLNFFKVDNSDQNLDHYIVARNPQSPDDIDRLTREFMEKKQSWPHTGYHFNE